MNPNLLITLLLSAALAACGEPATHDHDRMAHGHDDHGDDAAKGTHGGRLLADGDHALELAVAEDGIPPVYQAWLYAGGKPLPPDAGSVQVTVTRLAGNRETHVLTPRPDGSLMADSLLYEPHSFDAAVEARIEGRDHAWPWPSYEGRTTIDADIAAKAGIRVAPAGPGIITDAHQVQGLLTPIEGRVASITARFPGLVQKIHGRVGDTITGGAVLAEVESNLSLSGYAVKTPIAGTLMAVNITAGESVTEGHPLFEVADLRELWVDLHLFGADADHIQPGAAVRITRLSDGRTIETTLERILPGTASLSQSTVARARIPNDDAQWRPGSAVRADVVVARDAAAIVVPRAALQQFRDWDAVFTRLGDTYEVRPVEIGRSDGSSLEILSGLEPGDPVVVEQSYLVKADIEKSGAGHDH